MTPTFCLTFNPLPSELKGHSSNCRDCGHNETWHELQRADMSRGIRELVEWAAENSKDKNVVVEFVAETRFLTRDHAEGVVERRWPKAELHAC